MLQYNSTPESTSSFKNRELNNFIKVSEGNIDQKTVDSFGHEWTKFNSFSYEEITKTGDQYFDIVDDKIINPESLVLDVGCGTGRWSYYIADKVKTVEAIDPSDAVYSALELTKPKKNIRITKAGVDNIPFHDNSFDLVFSLGVFHHLPDTQDAITKSVKKVKKDGHFLVYLYYSLENRGPLFKFIFALSNIIRKVVSSLPQKLKFFFCDVLAIIVYFPMIVLSRFVKLLFPKKNYYTKIPLSFYATKTWLMIRNDSLDRFGTPLEKRFSKAQIQKMLENAGLTNIRFSEGEPYWHAIGKKV